VGMYIVLLTLAPPVLQDDFWAALLD
jgi:hypothetical protein